MHLVMQQTVEAARSSKACTQCRERKIKCSGTQPCRHFSRRQSECVFPDGGKKRLYSVAYVEDLKRRASIARHTDQNIISDPSSTSGNGAKFGDEASTRPPNHNIIDTGLSDSPTDMTDRLALDPVMSSSSRFGSHVKNLKSKASDSWDRSAEAHTDSYSLLAELASPVEDAPTSLHWPTQEDAYSLLDHVLTSIGTVQHLFDPRPLGDHLSLVCDQPQTEINIGSLWDIELLLVLAIGELLRGETWVSGSLPGARYFQEAARQTPGIVSLRASGIVAIEVMALCAFYLQCADCKDDAYLYAGMALRLAISHGMTAMESVGQIRQSDRTHRNRLAWSVYMQERRLAAATGNPFGLDDTEMQARWPFESPGFASATALSTNVRIARITGQIIRDVYRRKHETDDGFVKTTQDILNQLLDIDQKMSREFSIDYTVDTCITSRTTATLRLMLLQAKMLMTRPVLLYRTRENFCPPTELHTSRTDEPLILRLCDICIDSASRIIKILQAIRKQGILSKFGFFDLDAAVSAAFVFILAEASSSNIQHYRNDVKGALDVLSYLGTCGNRVAARKLTEIRQMCVQLDIDTQYDTEALEEGSQNDILDHPGAGPSNDLGTGNITPQPHAFSGPTLHGEGFEELSLSACLASCEGGFNFLELYRGDGMDTDGTIEMDWRAIERAILETEPDQDRTSQDWC
ncbi:hypothetical protein PFICI_13337 [Pestalotiopsis fici W106-1]|uniref:Zn(2)-C6 fungal-type domain-containing protein n=1 Tax=Pestalotiopsis fici (strain W106-1 / CGMCC3.15140) TaxID=1229662 RepID=W3WLW1_PESFW|nr:uncharacterized protein PFICI_13337 [Pestalotiopsis fici W106-1]ETS74853.1 hypothetical protein PFICI_13337 [Pestalotiopsis fici W106-1]